MRLAVFLLLCGTGCKVGPNYRRPPVSTPPAYWSDTGKASESGPSFGDLKWPEVFQDPVLRGLIQAALKQNYDLRIAASRILQAEAQLGITRSQEFPQVNGTASAGRQKTPPNLFFGGYTANSYQLAGNLSWILDFWGQYRRATEAARASLLASRYGRDLVQVTLISEVASSYFQLLELDLVLKISQDTLKSRQASLRLTEIKEQGGVSSILDVRQAESLVETAQTTITDTERSIQQTEDAISTYLGQNPGPIARGKPLDETALEPKLPAGLPSALLERRPDIRQAEEQLVAANAEIGVARAAFFPQISLTAAGGVESLQLARLFTSGIWSFAGDLTQPIFTAGRLKANLRLAGALRDESVLTYQKTIQEGFREVSDALIGYDRDRQFLAQQQALTKTLADADRLSRIRYQGGVTSYLEVLQQETQYFSAQLGLAQARLNEFTSVVRLYQALGGGW